MNSEFRIQNSVSNGFSQFKQNGFLILKSLVSENDCDRLAKELTPLFEENIKKSKSRIGGVRNLLRKSPLVASFATTKAVLELLKRTAGNDVFPVRAIFFDKNPESNWLVPWHQDLAIAVEERIETPGFTGWSTKDGMLHVHPPDEVLAGMIILRLHLDNCESNNGAVRVISGSHLDGKIPSSDVGKRTAGVDAIVCTAPKGGALLMSPLLLHASSPAESPCHRRVLHIEYATRELPGSLKWSDN